MTTQRITRAATLVALLGALATLPGCYLAFNEKTKWKFDKRFTIDGDKQSRVDNYGALLGKKGKPGDEAFGILVAPFSLFVPFEVGVSTGIFDPDRVAATLGSRSCVELNEEGLPLGTVFWFMCAEYLVDGTRIFNSADSQQQFYPGVTEVDLAFEADGVDLLFKARPRSTATWDVVTSVPFTPTAPTNASVGGVDLFKKGAIAWDGFFATNTDPPAPTLEDQLELAVFDSLDWGWRACDDLDGDPSDPLAPPDYASATTNLTQAAGSLDLAIATALLFPESKDRDKGVKKLEKSRKQYDKALDKIGASKERPAERQVRKSMDNQFEGLLKITPFPVAF